MVSILASADKEPAIATMVLAFAGDPATRWNWPHAQQYLNTMPRFVAALGGPAFDHRSAYTTDAYAGVALWLPPGVSPDEEMLSEIVQTTVSASIRDDVFAVFEQMAKYHPTHPHWHLPLIGVDPAHRGNGLGHALMTYALQRCDRERVPAYLESTNPRNITLYRRHGFEVLGTIQAGSSPTIVPMLRQPR